MWRAKHSSCLTRGVLDIQDLSLINLVNKDPASSSNTKPSRKGDIIQNWFNVKLI